jgi:hypothetical protein
MAGEEHVSPEEAERRWGPYALWHGTSAHAFGIPPVIKIGVKTKDGVQRYRLDIESARALYDTLGEALLRYRTKTQYPSSSGTPSDDASSQEGKTP